MKNCKYSISSSILALIIYFIIMNRIAIYSAFKDFAIYVSDIFNDDYILRALLIICSVVIFLGSLLLLFLKSYSFFRK